MSAATINTGANICCVQFSPDSPHIVAAGSANYRVYMYDLRNTAVPLAAVPGHQKAVSYVRFLGSNHLVSASTDNTLKLWDLQQVGNVTAHIYSAGLNRCQQLVNCTVEHVQRNAHSC